jgi:hypothetical protein
MTAGERLLSMAFLVLAVVAPSAVSAADAVKTAEASFPKKRVILIPGRDFRIDPEALFFEGDVAGPAGQEIGKACTTAAEFISEEPEIELTDLTAGRGQLEVEGLQNQELVVRGLLHLGIERYRDINLKEAISVLEEGIKVSLHGYADVLHPTLVSDLYLYLGLTRLETGEPELAHIALKNMFLLTPDKRFRSGWFPQKVEKALRAAAVDFVQSPPRENPLGTTERVAGFLKANRANALMYLYLESGSDKTVMLETRVFEMPRKESDSMGMTRDSRRWDGVTSASLAVSAWLACADLPSRIDTSRRLPRIFLETGASYSMFLADNTTRTGFHNLGGAVSLAYQIQPGLDTFIKFNFYRSVEDSYGDLLDDFWSIRTAIGVGYSAVFSWGRVFTHFGFEMNYLSGFRSSTDPRCKLWPDDPELCESSTVSKPSFLFGAMGLVGVNVFLSRQVFMTMQVGVSGYFVANENLSDLNSPFVTEIGFGYAFF